MMKRIYLLATMIGLGFSAARAQAPVSLERPYIDVTGAINREIVPDEIYIRITLQEKYEHKEKLSPEVQVEQLGASLKNAGIPLTNFYPSDVDEGNISVRKSGEVLSSKSYILMLSKASEVARTFLELNKLDVYHAAVVAVDHSALDSIGKAMRIEAMKAAKAKADYMLAALGQHTGKALIVQERTPDPAAQRDMNVQYKFGAWERNSLAYRGLGKGDKLSPGVMKLQAEVYIRFLVE